MFPTVSYKILFLKTEQSDISFYLEQKATKDQKAGITEKGGMALPNFMYYYWAANIRLLLYWMGKSAAAPDWTVMEGASIVSASPAALLCAKLPFTQPR